MPVTKITLSTAMRARDVSRPREDHLAEAAEREEKATRHAEPAPPRPAPPPEKAATPPAETRPAETRRPEQHPPRPPARRRRRRRS